MDTIIYGMNLGRLVPIAVLGDPIPPTPAEEKQVGSEDPKEAAKLQHTDEK